MKDCNQRYLTQRHQLWEQIARSAQGCGEAIGLTKEYSKNLRALNSTISISSFNCAYEQLKKRWIIQKNIELIIDMLDEFG